MNEGERQNERIKMKEKMKPKLIDMKSPDAVQQIQAATGWTRAKTRKFVRLHDETRCMERDEMIRARMKRS